MAGAVPGRIKRKDEQMTKFTFTIENTELTVTTQDGGSATIDLAQVHESEMARAFSEGVAEYIRDSRSQASANIYDRAHPDHDLKGEALRKARAAYAADHVAELAAESTALMNAAVEHMIAGTRPEGRAGSGGGAAFTPVQDAAYDIATRLRTVAGWSEIATTFAGAKGLTTRERKQAVLDTIESLDAKRRTAIMEAAESAVTGLDGLADLA